MIFRMIDSPCKVTYDMCELGKQVFDFKTESEARKFLDENPPGSTVHYITLDILGCFICPITMINGKRHAVSHDDYRKAVEEKRWREDYFKRTGKKWEDGEHTKESSSDKASEINSEKIVLDHNDCLAIFGLNVNFTQAELKKAYREEMKKYHPDKVASLAGEFKTLAEKRTKQINQALSKLLSKSKTKGH